MTAGPVLGIETLLRRDRRGGAGAGRARAGRGAAEPGGSTRRIGGVVPEIAARAHLGASAAAGARRAGRGGAGFADLGGVAATAGPGLIGGLIVGSQLRQGHRAGARRALRRGQPSGGACADRAAARPRAGRVRRFPICCCWSPAGIASAWRSRASGAIAGSAARSTTRPARRSTRWRSCSGCGWPGGPALERLAARGDPARFALPRPMLGRPGCDFSFSGLKTAVAQLVARFPPGALPTQDAADIAAGFQRAVADVLADRAAHAMAMFAATHPARATAGGGRRRRRQRGAARGAGARPRERARLRARGTAAAAVHRQRGDGGVGRHRAAAAAACRDAARPRAAPALAAGARCAA